MSISKTQFDGSSPDTITFTRKEAECLFTEIASVAEAAYRRGVQQAVEVGLSPEDALWYRYYRGNSRDRLYRYANPIPECGRSGKRWKLKCVDRMEWEAYVKDDGPFWTLEAFARRRVNLYGN
jgi:hypothetical protein